MKNVCLWALLHYVFVHLTPAFTQSHSQFENHISIRKIVIWAIWASFMSAHSLSAVVISGLWVVSANMGQNEDTKLFFPCRLQWKIPSLSTWKHRVPIGTFWPFEMGRFQHFPPPCSLPCPSVRDLAFPITQTVGGSICELFRCCRSELGISLIPNEWQSKLTCWAVSSGGEHRSRSCLLSSLQNPPLAWTCISEKHLVLPTGASASVHFFLLLTPCKSEQWHLSIFEPLPQGGGSGDSLSLERCLQSPPHPLLFSALSMRASQRQDQGLSTFYHTKHGSFQSNAIQAFINLLE